MFNSTCRDAVAGSRCQNTAHSTKIFNKIALFAQKPLAMPAVFVQIMQKVKASILKYHITELIQYIDVIIIEISKKYNI
jgi:hypothetical protein